ncbi:MAG: 30S ribosomal protein S12 methylthiotransferase RimO [Deltaproteobacteria bacterium]|nr:30S ribosomal protein S12 methylthiotransferase RimO [Deltaproteobacteria bacterium]
MAKVHFVSLGCPKNRVDAEHMLGLSIAGGHTVVENAEDADAIIINTCSFIGEAKKESIESVLEMGALKGQTGAKLIVTGCMAQRYVGELEKELPEVDAFLGTSDYQKIGDVLAGFGLGAPPPRRGKGLPIVTDEAVMTEENRNLVTTDLTFVAGCDLPRKNSMPKYTAYLKIAEGCDNTCAFCIIPTLRGKQRSRGIADLVTEATHLAADGVVELNLIAQDLTGYGHDLPGRPNLAQLLDALGAVKGIRWVRCMYMYPRTLSEHLLSSMNTSANALPYFDIPTQHGSDRMLLRMKRGKDQKKLGAMLTEVRQKVQHAVLRSTVIVGFPGEDDADFDKLMDFAGEVRFERLGVFKYSDEEGTAAYELDGKLGYAIKRQRFDKLMRKQRKIHEENNARLKGSIHEAIVEGTSEEHEWVMKGRLWSQAPEIDGITYFNTTRELKAGDVVHVEITEVKDYDVVGTVLEEDDPRIAESAPFFSRRSRIPACAPDRHSTSNAA